MTHEDPERFLRRLRVQPPAGYLRQLKARLDAQPPPRPPRRWRPLPGLLLASAVALAAVALRHPPPAPATPAAAPAAAVPEPARAAPQAAAAPGTRAAQPRALPAPTFAAQKSAGDTAAVLATAALEPYLKRHTALSTRITSAGEAVAQLCAVRGFDGPGMAAIDRRMTEPERQGCVVRLEEILFGYEAAFLVRSPLYGPQALSARAIFLALAREVPDPVHPQRLIANPYQEWSDVDPALPPDPIRVLGPSGADPQGRVLLAVLLLAGCHRVLPTASDTQCQGVRQDEAYQERTPGAALVRELQTNPTSLALVDLTFLAEHRDELSLSPLDGVVPDAGSIGAGAYPAARALYFYMNSSHAHAVSALASFRLHLVNAPPVTMGLDSPLISPHELQQQLPVP